MAIIGTGGTSYPDFYICLFLLTLTLISTVLNSLVIRHNFLKPPSLPRTLFLLLAITDLLAGIYIPIDYSIGGLSSRDMDECTSTFSEEFCNDHYMATFKPASVSDRVRTAIRQILTLMPCYITGLLATTRFLQIKYPFREIKEMKVFGFLIFALSHICVVYILFYRAGDEMNPSVVTLPTSQSSWNMVPSIIGFKVETATMYFVFIIFVLVLQIVAVFTSALTIWELIKMFRKPMTTTARRNSLTGSLKILITNMGSILNIAAIITKAYISTLRSMKIPSDFELSKFDGVEYGNRLAKFIDGQGMAWMFIYIVFQNAIIPTVLSTLNPGIYIIFTSNSIKSNKKKCSTLHTSTLTATVKSRCQYDLREESL